MNRRRVAAVSAVLIGGLAAALFIPPPVLHSIRHFEPAVAAEREVDMWQAYYAKENVRLFGGLVAMLREQYGFSWWGAAVTGFYLARPAARFAVATGEYDAMLPDLTYAYARIRQRTAADFDPAAVARAELAWWVARRLPGENDPANVGRLIAEKNALIFGEPVARLIEASTLRARAGRLRDDGGADADWAEVSRLLHLSYRELYEVLSHD